VHVCAVMKGGSNAGSPYVFHSHEMSGKGGHRHKLQKPPALAQIHPRQGHMAAIGDQSAFRLSIRKEAVHISPDCIYVANSRLQVTSRDLPTQTGESVIGCLRNDIQLE